MQLVEDQFNCWYVFFWVDVDWYFMIIVNDFQGLVGMKDNFYVFGVVCQCFIYIVINNFLIKMVRMSGVGIYVWMVVYWFQFGEYFNGISII